MIAENVEKRIIRIIEKITVSYSGYLPFGGKYLKAFGVVVAENANVLKHNWNEFFATGDASKLIDFLIDFARGNLPVPFYLKPFAGPALEVLRKWLHDHEDLFRDAVGTVV